MAVPKSTEPLDVLQQMFNDVLIHTGKALRTANRDGKGGVPQASATLGARIPTSIDTFNSALDELESDILRAKSVLQRDLNQLKAKRQLPPPPLLEQKPVAPPAPMVVDLDPPPLKITAASAQVKAVTPSFQPFSGTPRSAKLDNTPVAPFPNMGFDLTVSPELESMPSPLLLKKEPKNSPRPRPASGPPRKDARAPPPAQVPRPVTAPPSTQPSGPVQSLMQAKLQIAGKNQPAPVTQTSGAVAPSAGAGAGAQTSSATAAPPGPENIFTNMTFSLAPTPSETQSLNQSQQTQQQQQQQQQQHQQPDMGLAGLGPADMPSFDLDNTFPSNINLDGGGGGGGGEAGAADDTKMTNDVDAKIEGLFDLGSASGMDMDYDVGGDDGDNSNFEDLFFNTGDDTMAAGEFDNAYFHLS
ncbi:hypothetical protein B0H63DRAFT_260918 [Podospora didyma]|uniref:Uncharacterized protein n=1 Tax=Podospora didyma TaxID=330526 RepID=A0AAE0KEW5_9PEZI|nr:hypothetical protein B0H63DRAFT_260918 [Podospora didyma]